MSNKALMGFWRHMLPIPQTLWRKRIDKVMKKIEAELGFMSEEHRMIHHFVVQELPRVGKPLSSDFIANELDLPLPRVTAILDELERNMTFLFINNEGEVVWAYPVTVETTPHHITLSTGEQVYAA